MGRSDSRSGPLPGLCFPLERRGSTPPPRRVSQAPRLICPHALSPFTPESPKAAVAHSFTSGSRLHHTWKTGHFPFALTGPYRVCGRYGSRVRLPELCQSDCSFPRLVGYLLYEQLQGKLLSAYKISQAFPGVPGPRYSPLHAGPRQARWLPVRFLMKALRKFGIFFAILLCALVAGLSPPMISAGELKAGTLILHRSSST